MTNLRQRFISFRLFYEVLSPIQLNIAMAFSFLIFVAAITNAILGHPCFSIFGPMLIGIAVALLSVYKGIMLSMLNSMIAETLTKGFNIGVPRLVVELHEDQRKERKFRLKWFWVPAFALFASALADWHWGMLTMIVTASIFSGIICAFNRYRYCALLFLLPLLIHHIFFRDFSFLRLVGFPPDLYGILSWLFSVTLTIVFSLMAFVVAKDALFSKRNVIEYREEGHGAAHDTHADHAVMQDGLLATVFLNRLITAGALGTADASEIYGGASDSNSPEALPRTGRGQVGPRAGLAEKLADEDN